jgi:hypothetical protein
MKTPTAVVEQTPLDQLRGEVDRLSADVTKSENKLAAAHDRALRLSGEIEEAETALIHGRLSPDALNALRERHARELSEDAQLPSDIRIGRRLLAKAQEALAIETDRTERERRRQVRRTVCELAAPFLDQAVRAVDGLLQIPGISDVVSLDQAFSGAITVPEVKIREVLAGRDSGLAVLIRDLKSAAPDLITPAMQALLDRPRTQSLQRSPDAPLDAKVVNRNHSDAIRAQLKSWEQAWFSRASDARSIPQVGAFR